MLCLLFLFAVEWEGAGVRGGSKSAQGEADIYTRNHRNIFRSRLIGEGEGLIDKGKGGGGHKRGISPHWVGGIFPVECDAPNDTCILSFLPA